MYQNPDPNRPIEPKVTIKEVNWVLEVGRLIFSVLIEKEKSVRIKEALEKAQQF